MIAQLVAILAAALFSGAATYINVVEHPARLELGTEFALREFAPSYRRATLMQASLALVGLAAGIVAWVISREVGWLVGALLLGSVVPFTLVVIFPTNKRLLDPALDTSSAEAARLLARWARLHAIRSLLSAAALLTFVVVLL